MSKQYIWFPLVTLVFVCCQQQNSQRQPQPLPGVIFTVEQTEKVIKVVQPPSTAAWLPSQEEVEELEARLPQFLESQNLSIAREIRDSLASYRRQYLGVVQESRRVIYVNAFCSHSRADDDTEQWKQVYVFVMDGGACYFQVCYDPETKRFFRFTVNGVA